jgi:hypothetical protein
VINSVQESDPSQDDVVTADEVHGSAIRISFALPPLILHSTNVYNVCLCI